MKLLWSLPEHKLVTCVYNALSVLVSGGVPPVCCCVKLMWPELNILFFTSLWLQFTDSTDICSLFSLFTTSSGLCDALKCSLWLLSCISLKTTGIKSLTVTKGEHFVWPDTIDWKLSTTSGGKNMTNVRVCVCVCVCVYICSLISSHFVVKKLLFISLSIYPTEGACII